MQSNQFKIEKLENKPNKKTTDGRENHNDRRDESFHRPRDDDDEVVCRIKIDPLTFDGIHDYKIFIN